jgi:glycosyltransferase 2 family protein
MRENNPGKKRWPIGMFVRLAISLVLVGWIIWWLGGLGTIAAIMGRISLGSAALVIIFIMLDRALTTFKWTCLLRSQGIHLPFFRGMKIYCASMVWGLFMPVTIGADAVRTYMSTRTGLNASQVIASIIVERIIGFFASLLMALCGFALLSQMGLLDARFDAVGWIGGIALVGACVAFPLSLSPRAIEWLHSGPLRRFQHSRLLKLLRGLQENYEAYRHKKGTLAGFFSMSVLEQLVTIFYVWLIARGFGVHVSLIYVFGALPLAILIARVPISVSGLGVFDGAFAFLISFSGVSLAEAVAITVGMRILEVAAWTPWWLASVIQVGNVRGRAIANSEIKEQPTASSYWSLGRRVVTRENPAQPSALTTKKQVYENTWNQ